jgi:hypothetical protein
MIRDNDPRQPLLPGFEQFFGVPLDEENRWIKLSKVIPWEEFAEAYYQNMNATTGRPAKKARLVIGALIIKHKLCLSDEETIEQIRENPYLQYFVGLPVFQTKAPFTPSLFVEIRRRMGGKVFSRFNQAIIDKLENRQSDPDDRPRDGSPPPSGHDKEQSVANNGRLILDATVAEQAVRFPTDLDLLNEAREISEKLIDVLYPQTSLKKKPRTYRRQARKAYLALAKQRRPGTGKRLRGIRQQLQYLRRNLGHVEKLLDLVADESKALSFKQRRQYWIIQHVYHQQEEMYRNRSHRCEHRIVSISQPHIRPMVRGKAGKSVEFGAKISVSLDKNQLAHVDHLGWEAFHEGHDLPAQVEAYKKRYGCYPEVVFGDRLYGSRANRKYLAERGIRFAGKKLGRPQSNRSREQLKKEQLEYRQRIPIEGKFGQGKNGYRLNHIRAKTKATSEAWIYSIFLVMNLLVLARNFFAPLKNIVWHSYSVVKELFLSLGKPWRTVVWAINPSGGKQELVKIWPF